MIKRIVVLTMVAGVIHASSPATKARAERSAQRKNLIMNKPASSKPILAVTASAESPNEATRARAARSAAKKSQLQEGGVTLSAPATIAPKETGKAEELADWEQAILELNAEKETLMDQIKQLTDENLALKKQLIPEA